MGADICFQALIFLAKIHLDAPGQSALPNNSRFHNVTPLPYFFTKFTGLDRPHRDLPVMALDPRARAGHRYQPQGILRPFGRLHWVAIGSAGLLLEAVWLKEASDSSWMCFRARKRRSDPPGPGFHRIGSSFRRLPSRSSKNCL